MKQWKWSLWKTNQETVSNASENEKTRDRKTTEEAGVEIWALGLGSELEGMNVRDLSENDWMKVEFMKD